MTAGSHSRRFRLIATTAIIAVALASVTLLPFPASQDSAGEGDTYTVTLLKNDFFELRDGTGAESSVFPSEGGGTYTFDGPTTAYVAFKHPTADRTLVGVIIDGGSMSTGPAVHIDRDMTVLPVEKLKGNTIATGGELSTEVYVAAPDYGTGTYTASIAFPNQGGWVEIAAHVAGVSIVGVLDGNVLNLTIEDEVGYRGTIPATMTLHRGSSMIEWHKVFVFIAGPLVDADPS
jgi:hypothetical protein